MAESSFEDLEEDYNKYAASLSRKISKVSESGSSDAARSIGADASALAKKAQRCVAGMETALRQMAPSQRRRYVDKVSQYKADLGTLRKDLDRAVEAARREALMGSAGRSAAERAADDRAAAATDRVKRSTARLHDAQRQVAESEEIGVNVMGGLQDQRQTLLRAHEKVQDVNTLTGRARNIIKTIQRRAVTNKLILGGTVFLLVVADVLIAYYLYIR